MLVDADGACVQEGTGEGFTGLQLRHDGGRDHLRATLESLAATVRGVAHPEALHAGVTGLDGDEPAMRELLAQAFGIPRSRVSVGTDIEVACRDLFAPGEGYLLYAGTGSFAAFIDAAGALHRAGGRGPLLDDGGSGYWIGLQALRHIWRAEDERPGAWRDSPLARAVFARMGGDDWRLSRRMLYEGTRGEVGALALAVASVAEEDPDALAILVAAGGELARLALSLLGRHGARPIAMCGRATVLHPAIEAALRSALPDNTVLEARICNAHRAAARLALAHGAASRT